MARRSCWHPSRTSRPAGTHRRIFLFLLHLTSHRLNQPMCHDTVRTPPGYTHAAYHAAMRARAPNKGQNSTALNKAKQIVHCGTSTWARSTERRQPLSTAHSATRLARHAQVRRIVVGWAHGQSPLASQARALTAALRADRKLQAPPEAHGSQLLCALFTIRCLFRFEMTKVRLVHQLARDIAACRCRVALLQWCFRFLA